MSKTALSRLLAPLAVFGAVLVAMAALNGGAASPPALSAGGDLGRPSGDPLRDAQAAVRAAPASATVYAGLGDAYLSRARESGDPGFYSRAERAFDVALRRDPRDVAGLVGAGTLAGLRHDFGTQLRLGKAALKAAPELARPLTVIADAQIELGRYDEAGQTIQRLVDLKPALASYARVSYFRELHGDVDGAVAAMRLAVSAGGSPEGTAYVQTLLGDLELGRGRTRAARDDYRFALRELPSYPQALTGLARLDVASGDLNRPPLACVAPRTGCHSRARLRCWPRWSARRRMFRAARADLAAARVQHALLGNERHAARRRGRPLRGEPRFTGPGGSTGRARVARRPEHPFCGRTRMGPHARGPRARGVCLGSSRFEDGVARPAVSAACGRGGAACRAWARSRAAFRFCNKGSSGPVARGRSADPRGGAMTLSRFPLYFNGKCNRVVVLALIAAVFAALSAAPAEAHPLGNFSVNHLSTVSISKDRVDVRYILDQAEIPTVQERGLGRAEVLRRKLDEVRRGLILTVDGRPTELHTAGAPQLTFPTGAGGLTTTRLELTLNAAVRNARRVDARGQHIQRQSRLEGNRLRTRQRNRRPDGHAERRSHRRPAPLPARPPRQPGRPPQRELLGPSR